MLDTYLAKALKCEDIAVKLGDRLYLPGSLQKDARPGIVLDGLPFALEPAATVRDLGILFFRKNPGFVRENFDQILGDSGLEKRMIEKYTMNWALRTAVEAFDFLRKRVDYQGYLNHGPCTQDYPYGMTEVPVDGPYEMGEFTGLIDYKAICTAAVLTLPDNALLIGNLAYCLTGDATNIGLAVRTPEGKTLYAAYHGSCKDVVKAYEKEIREGLRKEIEQIDPDEIEEPLDRQHDLIWQTIRRENYAADGLTIKSHRIGTKPQLDDDGDETGSSEECAIVEIAMALPEMAMKIPGKTDYITFKQANLILKFSRILYSTNTSADPVKYYSTDPRCLHPIVYQKAYYGERLVAGKEDQVCIRDLGPDLLPPHDASFPVRLAYSLLGAREMVMYGTNLFTRLDEHRSTAIVALIAGNRGNWHRITDRRLLFQRRSAKFVRHSNIMVVGVED